MTDPILQQYYNQLVAFQESRELRSLPNEDRRHNATILCFMLNTSTEVNMYCGEMSIFRDNFYSYVDDACNLKNDMIVALAGYIQRENVKLNIIVENYCDSIFSDLICSDIFRTGIQKGKINMRKLNKNSAVTDGLTHCVYTNTKAVRIEEDKKEHSGMFLANMSDTLLEKLKSNYNYLTQSSELINVAI